MAKLTKDIRYDAEGDILYVTFEDADGQPSTGIELTENIIFYFNPETKQPLKMILISYARLLAASVRQPLPLDGLADTPASLKKTILSLLARTPAALFLQLVEPEAVPVPTSRLAEVFTPAVLKAAA